MLAGGKRNKERDGGEPIHPSTPAQGLLNGIPYAGWWRVRERKKKVGKLPFWREKARAFEIHGAFPLYLESLNTGLSQLFLSDVSEASEWQSTLSFKSSILLRAHHFQPCSRFPRWDVDPEC
jgi:hypothetical protein